MKLAICIPFRDTGDGVRQGHLDKFIPHLTEFLNERSIEHKFFIGHQDDDNLFKFKQNKETSIKIEPNIITNLFKSFVFKE